MGLGDAGLSPAVRCRGRYCTYFFMRSEEHTSELQSQSKLECRLLLEKTDKIWAGPSRHVDCRAQSQSSPCYSNDAPDVRSRYSRLHSARVSSRFPDPLAF